MGNSPGNGITIQSEIEGITLHISQNIGMVKSILFLYHLNMEF